MEEETKTAMILGLIVFGAIIGAGIASAYWIEYFTSKKTERGIDYLENITSEILARNAIINLDRANIYLMKGDNYTARLFLESAIGFVGAINNPTFREISQYYENGTTIIETYGTMIISRIMHIVKQLKDFNISKVSNLTEKINKTIVMIMPYSDIPKYKDKVPEFEELYEKYVNRG